MDKNYSFSPNKKLLSFILKSCLSGFIFCFSYAAVLAQTSGNALLFVENLDRFPSNDRFVFSKVQIPFSRDSINYNANHDSLVVRIHNKGLDALVVQDLILSNDTSWRLVKLKGADYDSSTSLPLRISSGTYADLTVMFVPVDSVARVKILNDTLTIVSNDSKAPVKALLLSGLLQRQGEQNNEPYAGEIISAFGFKTRTGFVHTDINAGDTATPLKGDEIRPSYFMRADTSKPASIRQMAAYHGCCTQIERIKWFPKGQPDSVKSITTHIGLDAQTLLPRRGRPSLPASGSISPKMAFGFEIGRDKTDPKENPGGKIGVRVWKAFDANGNIIPNSYIISNDYLGTRSTNFDYNDNMYFIRNVRPETGTAYFSALAPAPSALDFGEQLLQSTNSLTLNLSNLGQRYSDGSTDPGITIDSVEIVGENQSEFSTAMPTRSIIYQQGRATLTVDFNPVSQGLKIADLKVYYNNFGSSLRVPLYGIAKAADTTVTAHYRINSGSATPITINGKTWGADSEYAFDNLEPYTNSRLTQVAGTEEDSLYLKEQSSDGNRKPFRYQFPIENGEYVVRLHFAEIYWGAPGSGLNGGVGSRVMNVSLENELRLVNLDVTQEVGAATALVKNIPVTVTDSQLNINFSANADRPMVVAIEVYSFRASNVLSSVVPDPNVLATDEKLTKPKVFPNPAQKRFRIKFPSEYSGDCTVQIADASGKTYQVGKTKLQRGRTNNMDVDISGLSLTPGFYSLKLNYETRANDVIKLIVK